MRTPPSARRALLAMVALATMGRAAAIEEVPFITTPDHVTIAMLEIARVGPRDHVIDLGSGDGRIVITAARRFGATGLGVDIDPTLIDRSRANAAKAGVTARVSFHEQDLFKTELSAASVITMYLLPDVNLALRPALLALKPGTRIVSHDWDMAEWLPDRTTTIEVPDKQIGREKLSRVHLWVVPAQVAGRWCGPRGAALQLDQQFQQAQGRAFSGRDAVRVWGRIDGATIDLGSRESTLRVAVGGNTGRVTHGTGAWAAWRGWRFTRAAGANCPV